SVSLSHVAVPAVVRQLIERAWERVSTCSCQHDDRLACPDCLLPYTRSSQLQSTSRSAAERALRSILLDGPASAELKSVDDADKWDIKVTRPERSETSQLALRFRVLLRKALQDRHAAIEDREKSGH